MSLSFLLSYYANTQTYGAEPIVGCWVVEEAESTGPAIQPQSSAVTPSDRNLQCSLALGNVKPKLEEQRNDLSEGWATIRRI